MSEQIEPTSNALPEKYQNAALDQNPAVLYLAQLKPVGRRGMLHALERVVEILSDFQLDLYTFPWKEISRADVIRIVLSMRDSLGYKPASINHTLSAIRGVLREAYHLGQISADDMQRAISVKNVKYSFEAAGRDLSQGELHALLLACYSDNRKIGTRDAAMIALMYQGGLRREEVVHLQREEVYLAQQQLKVTGKGTKQRTIFLSGGTQNALNDWLEIRGMTPGPLFCPIRKGGKMALQTMTTQAVYYILKTRGKQAGVSHFSPHDIRRTFVGDLLDAGADIATVAKMAGHANVQTTARYDRRGDETQKKAADLLHVPYQQRLIKD
jgi:site-specific recombinase XerD